MAARIRALDWAATPLGPVAAWSERLKVMVEQVLASPCIASLVCGPERALVYNDAAARLYGGRHPFALGRPLPEAFPERWATVAPFYERAFAGDTVRVVGQPLDTGGEGAATDVFDAMLTPVREADGRVAHVHMTGSEVGDRARGEAALRDSEARHRLLIESWAQATWETDAEGHVVEDSPSWRAYTGQTLGEWLGYGWLDAIHPDDRAGAERQWRKAVAVGGPVDAEFRLRAREGGWRWTNVRAAPVLDAGGGIEKWLGLNIDIDDRKRAEAALRVSEGRYRALFESMDQAYAVVEVLRGAGGRWADFRFLEVNRAFLKHTTMPWPVGRTATELLGSPNPRWTELYGHALDTGEPLRVEEFEATLGLTFDLNIFSLDRDRNRVAVLFTDITERKKAEAAQRENQRRQGFLLRLSDSLRAEPDADAVAARAARMLAEQLDLDLCFTAKFHPSEGRADVGPRFRRPGAPPLPESDRLSDLSAAFRQMSGRTLVFDDVARSPALSGADRLDIAALDFGALVSAGARRGASGPPLWSLTAVTRRPRRWTAGEITLIEEATERTWAAAERARAETALRESEERFQQFARASAAGLWIRNAHTLAMEFVSPAVATIYGVEAGALLGDAERWASMILPEDRDVALQHLREARAGRSAVHEFRIWRPSDGAVRWIRNTDFPLRDDGHIPRIGGIAEDITEAKRAGERQDVLVAELQHRTRNLIAVVQGIANETMEHTGPTEAFRDAFADRMSALSRVQGLLSRSESEPITVEALVRLELDAIGIGAGAMGARVAVEGPEVFLKPSTVQTFALALHELATNARKYGALSHGRGRLVVAWRDRIEGDHHRLALDWVETGLEQAPERPALPKAGGGYGRELIEHALPHALGARTSYALTGSGVRCTIDMPVRPGRGGSGDDDDGREAGR